MAYQSSHKFARISARKARLVTALICGRSYAEAMAVLDMSKKRAAVMVKKVLATAAANAANQGDLRNRDLVVSTASVDEGPTVKRWRPKDRGRAHQILKRTCHINVAVDKG